MLSFGTDGIRGRANEALSVSLALAVGVAVADVFGESQVLVGRDTRESGPMLQAAVSAGLMSRGTDALDMGVAPTGEIAFASSSLSLPAVVVSASHNPYFDNGLKVFAPGGRKLSDRQQHDMELRIASYLGDSGSSLSPVELIGGTRQIDMSPNYIDHIMTSVGGVISKPPRVVLDFANGAASLIGPKLFNRLGVEVVGAIGDSPDGRNINFQCGSTHPKRLSEAVVASGADLGLAFDGDADRVIAVDETGELVDGDQLMVIFAKTLARQERLTGSGMVATVMSNLGLHKAMAEAGIRLVLTPVGDRFVLDALEREGYALGGEQSGHIIFADYATTGDGLLTGALLLAHLAECSTSFSELVAGSMVKFPQILESIRVDDPAGAVNSSRVIDVLAQVESELGDSGRVVLRASGTEPVVRVMVEAVTLADAETAVSKLMLVLGRHS